jgi:hypothetical protein
MMYGKNPGTEATWQRIAPFSVGAELGVWKGYSTLKLARNAAMVTAVDAWSPVAYENSDEFGDYQSYLDRYSNLVGSNDPQRFQDYYDAIHMEVVEKFKAEPKIQIKRMTTDEWFDSMGDSVKIDWIYVDASHSYDGCLNDLRRSLNVVKSGGHIYGDDYGKNKQGVTDAVDAFIKESGLTLNNFYTDQYEIRVP